MNDVILQPNLVLPLPNCRTLRSCGMRYRTSSIYAAGMIFDSQYDSSDKDGSLIDVLAVVDMSTACHHESEKLYSTYQSP